MCDDIAISDSVLEKQSNFIGGRILVRKQASAPSSTKIVLNTNAIEIQRRVLPVQVPGVRS